MNTNSNLDNIFPSVDSTQYKTYIEKNRKISEDT